MAFGQVIRIFYTLLYMPIRYVLYFILLGTMVAPRPVPSVMKNRKRGVGWPVLIEIEFWRLFCEFWQIVGEIRRC